MRFRIRRADGVYRWTDQRAEPLRDADGRIVQWYGLCLDVDELKRTEDALRRSEREFRDLLDTLPAMVWGTRAVDGPTYFNKTLLDYTGYRAENVGAPGGTNPGRTARARPSRRPSLPAAKLRAQLPFRRARCAPLSRPAEGRRLSLGRRALRLAQGRNRHAGRAVRHPGRRRRRGALPGRATGGAGAAVARVADGRPRRALGLDRPRGQSAPRRRHRERAGVPDLAVERAAQPGAGDGVDRAGRRRRAGCRRGDREGARPVQAFAHSTHARRRQQDRRGGLRPSRGRGCGLWRRYASER